jgi:hypothetical protein
MKILKGSPICLIGFITIFLLFTGPAEAGDPNGVWSSSTGSVVKIWANMQQLQITVSNQNGSWNYRGWWTRFGDYFSYEVPGAGVWNGAFANNNSNVIYVKDPKGQTYTWTRGAKKQFYSNNGNRSQQKQQVNINGVWQSNSGNAFNVSTKGNQVFVTIVRPDGSRIQGLGRWIVKGSKFDYSITGYAGQAICTIKDANTIYVNFNGQITTWYRR